MPMNQEIKARWVQGLRDPALVQGFGALRTEDNKQCCLNILMQEAVDAGVQEPAVLRINYMYPDASRVDLSRSLYLEDTVLTRQVAIWAGLENANGVPRRDPWVRLDEEARSILDGMQEIYVNKTSYSLSGCNDDLKLSFAKIADLIEADESL